MKGRLAPSSLCFSPSLSSIESFLISYQLPFFCDMHYLLPFYFISFTPFGRRSIVAHSRQAADRASEVVDATNATAARAINLMTNAGLQT